MTLPGIGLPTWDFATTNHLFKFDGLSYEQTDGVAMGSPLGPLLANVFMCHLEEKLTRDGLMPHLYRRCLDDTLARMPSTDASTMFLNTLNGLHPSLTFTMVLPVNGRISFIGIEIVKNGTGLELKSMESQQIQACSYIFIVILINAMKALY